MAAGTICSNYWKFVGFAEINQRPVIFVIGRRMTVVQEGIIIDEILKKIK